MQVIVDVNGTALAAYHGSTFGPITAGFFDAAGSAVTPISVTWSLTDASGNIMNEREAEVLTPAETVDVLLSGNDLIVGDDEAATYVNVNKVVMREVKRYLRVSAIYTSDEGANLPLVAEVQIPLRALVTTPAV